MNQTLPRLTPMTKQLFAALLSTASVICLSNGAQASPVGGDVVAGGATIAGQGTSTVNITQSTQRVVINWNGFDTSVGESVNFYQPNSNAIALNRILSGSPTQFNGQMNANGKVIVMNPNGIVFGNNAQIDVNGLVATTANISNQSFMNDAQLKFDQVGNANASIINHGTITVRDAGLVGFVAPQVENSGTIQANLGKVQLASGDHFTFDLYGDGLVEIAASDAINHQLAKNSGLIQAAGGTISLTAAEAKQAVDAIILNTGTIEATSVSQQGGKIILGGTKANVTNTGIINASGTTGGQIIQNGKTNTISGSYLANGSSGKGGAIDIGGDTTFDHATVQANGATAGGTIHVGGTWKNSYKDGRVVDGIQLNATNSVITDANTNLSAAVLGTHGDGGEIVLWGQALNSFGGSLNAKGGSLTGKGGRAEISASYLDIQSSALLTTGYAGRQGNILFDPKNLTIATAGAGTLPQTYGTTPSVDSTISVATVTAILNGGNNLTLQANNEITISNDIIVNNPSGNGGDFTLQAGKSINLNANITTDNGALTFIANDTVANGVVDAQRSSGTGSIVMAGGTSINAGTGAVQFILRDGLDKTYSQVNGVFLTSITAGSLVVDSAGSIVSNAAGSIQTSGSAGISLTAATNIGITNDLGFQAGGTGAIIWRANGNIVNNAGGDITTAGGKIELNADRDGTGGGYINIGSFSEFRSNGGNIILGGGATNPVTGYATGYDTNAGVSLATGSLLNASGTGIGGNIYINGQGWASATCSNNCFGVRVAGTITTSETGSITINALSGGTGASSQAHAFAFINGSITAAKGDISITAKALANASGRPFSLGGGTIQTTDVGNIYLINSTDTALSTGNYDAYSATSITSGGSIHYVTDRIGSNTNMTTTAAKDVIIRPYTAGVTVGLNMNSLSLSVALLNSITTGSTGTLWLGGYGNPGDVGYINNAGDFTFNYTTPYTFANNVHVMSAGNINSNGTVTISASSNKNITFSALNDITPTGGYNLNLSTSGTGSITLRANRDIINSGSITTTGGAIVINSDRDGVNGGRVAYSGALTSGGGAITVGGGVDPTTGYAQGYDTNTGASVTGTTTAAGGNIIINGAGWQNASCSSYTCIGVTVGSISTTGSGSITINGVSGGVAATANMVGVFLNGVTLTTVTGNINITASTNSTQSSSMAIRTGNYTLQTNGTGSIYLTSANAAGSSALSFNNFTGTSALTSGGNIIITADKAFATPSNYNINATGNVTFKTYNAATTVNVGSGSGGLDLTSTVLNRVATAGSITIGSNLGNGAMAVNAYSWIAPVTFLSNNGNITFSGAQTMGARSLTAQTYGSGNIAFNTGSITTSATGTAVTLISNQAITMTGTNSITSSAGTVTATSVGNMSLMPITATGVTATATGSGSKITTSSIAVGTGGNVTLTSDDVDLSGAISGTGVLTLQPYDTARVVRVNWNADDGSTYYLGTADLNNLTNNWGSILVGRTNSVANIMLHNSAWVDPVTFRSTVAAYVDGTVSGTDDASFIFGSTYFRDGSVTTVNRNASFSSVVFERGATINLGSGAASVSGITRVTNGNLNAVNVTATGGITFTGVVSNTGSAVTGKTVTLNAGTGTIAFGSTVDGPFNLSATANSITFNGAWGATTALGTVSLTAVNNMALPAITAANLYLSDTGTVTQTGAITVTNLLLSGAGATYTLTNASNSITTFAANTGTLSFSETNGFTVGSVNGTNGLTATGNATLSVSTGIIDNTQAIAVGANNLTLIADDFNFGTNVSGTGILTLQTVNGGRHVYINYNSQDGVNLYLGAADIAKLVDGWSNIIIGNAGIAAGRGYYIGASTWTDPVYFLGGSSTYFQYGQLTGTGNASFKATANRVYMYSGISTQGGAIDYSGTAFTNTGNYLYCGTCSFTTNGGNISFAGVVVGDYAGTKTFSTSGGNISFAYAVGEDASAQSRTLSLNAGAGSVTFNSTVNGSYNMDVTAATITAASAWGGTSNLGNVTLTSVNNITLPSITTIAGKAVSITATGAGKKITTGAIATGALGNITLTSDDVTIGGALSGTGTVTLQPYATNRTVRINAGTDNGTYFFLDTTEISNLTNGWGLVNIGRIDSAAGTFIGSTSWIDPIVFRSSTGITLNSALSGSGDASFTFSGATAWVDLYSSITTVGQKVDFSGVDHIWLGTSGGSTITTAGGNALFNKIDSNAVGNLTVNTTSGNIDIANTIYGASGSTKTFTFNAGTGSVNFANTVSSATNLSVTGSTITASGAWTNLGDVTLTSVNDITLPAITTAAGKTVSVTATGAGNKITASTIATGTGGNITLTADDLILNGNLTGTGTVTLQPYATNRVVNVAAGTDNGSTFHLSTADLTKLIDNWGTINIGNVNSSVNLNIGSSTFTDPVNFRSGSRISVLGGNTLAGTGNASITFSGTGWTDLKSGSNVTTAGQSVSFNQSYTAVYDGAGISTNNGSISFANNVIMQDDGVSTDTFNAGSGNITFGGTLTGAGLTNANRTLSLISTGTVSFANTVNGSYNITGTGNSYAFNGAWGGSTALGNVTLTSVNDIVLPAITTAAGKTVAITATGAGKKITTSSIATGTGGNITLTADDLGIGGNLSGTGVLTVKSQNASRDIRINYGADDGSTLYISTAEVARLNNGWSAINIGEVAKNDRIYYGDSSWSSPVTFRAGTAHLINGNVAGTGNASLTFIGGTGSLYTGNVTTVNGNIDFSGLSQLSSESNPHTISSINGNIILPTLSDNAASSLNVTTTNGNITLNNGIISSGFGNSTSIWNFDAANGTLLINGTVNTPLNIVGNGNTVNFNGAWGGSTALGNVTLTSMNGITLPAITTAAGKTVDITVTGAGNRITASSIATGTNGNITLTADDLDINGALSGTGTITLQPYASNRYITVDNGSGSGTAFHLNTADIGNLTSGWSSIIIGRADMASAAIYLLTNTTWDDPVTFRTGGGDVISYASIAGTGNASINFNIVNGTVDARNSTISTNNQDVTFSGNYFAINHYINTNGGNIVINGAYSNAGSGSTFTTSGGNITLAGTSTLGGDAVFNAGTGTVAFGNTVNGAGNLSVTGQNITFNGAWGGSTALGDVTLTSVNDIILPAITTAAGKTVSISATGTGKKITTSTIATGTNGNIILTADDLAIGGNLSGTGVLTLKSQSASRDIRINTGTDDGSALYIDTAEVARLNNGWSLINIGEVAKNDRIYYGDSAWSSSVIFRGGVEHLLYGNVSGTGNTSFTFIGGTGNLYIGNITTASGNIDLSGLNQLTIENAAHTISSVNGNIILPTLVDNFATALNVTTTNGNITLNNGIAASGFGNSSTIWNFNAANGTLLFNGTVNTPLNIVGNADTLAFNGVWGGSTALGNVTLTSVNDITLPAITTSAGKTIAITATGVGKKITTGAIVTGTNGNITLTADDVAIGGNLSGTGTLTLQPYSTSRVIDINYGPDNGTHFDLSTAELGRLVNGWNLINVGKVGSSSVTNIGASSWIDPITFYGGNKKIYGDIVGSGNASFTFVLNPNESVQGLGGNITTAGQDVIVTGTDGMLYTNNPFTISTNGGNVNIVSTALFGATTINTAGGNITLGQTYSEAAVNLNAGTGTINFNSQLVGTSNFNLTANANTINTTIPWGVPTALGNISLTTVNSITLPSINAASVVVTVTGAGNRITTGDISTGTGGNITLTSDDVTIGGNLSGTGTLILQPNSTNRTVRVNSGTDDGSSYFLDATEIAQLNDNWGNIYIDRADNGAYQFLGTATFIDPVTFRNGVGIVNGALTGTGNASFTLTAPTIFNYSSITTAGGHVTINGTIDLNNTTGGTIATNGGNINLNGNINGTQNVNYNIVADAGTGTVNFGGIVTRNSANSLNVTANGNAITFNGDWGSGPLLLGNVTLTSVNNITLPNMYASSVNFTATGAGNKITTADITTGTGGNITLTSDDVAIGGNLSGTGTLTLQPYDVSRITSVNDSAHPDNGASYHLSTAELSRLTDGWSQINVGRINGAGIVYIGNSSWIDPVYFRSPFTTYATGNLTGTDNAFFYFGGTVISRNASITTAGQNITFSSGLTAETGLQVATNGGNILINSPLIIDKAFNSLSPVTFSTSGGNITVAGLMYEANTGTITGKTVTFNAGAGAVAFGNTVNGSYNVAVNANAITFNGAWGGSTPLGDVTLNSTGAALTLSNIRGRTITAQTGTGYNIDVVGTLQASAAGNSVVLASGRNFINSGSINPGSGRYLIYSIDPADDTLGSLVGATAVYNQTYASYGPSSVTETGNVHIYSFVPVVIPPVIVPPTTPPVTTPVVLPTIETGRSTSVEVTSDKTWTGSTPMITSSVGGGDNLGFYNINVAEAQIDQSGNDVGGDEKESKQSVHYKVFLTKQLLDQLGL